MRGTGPAIAQRLRGRKICAQGGKGAKVIYVPLVVTRTSSCELLGTHFGGISTGSRTQSARHRTAKALSQSSTADICDLVVQGKRAAGVARPPSRRQGLDFANSDEPIWSTSFRTPCRPCPMGSLSHGRSLKVKNGRVNYIGRVRKKKRRWPAEARRHGGRWRDLRAISTMPPSATEHGNPLHETGAMGRELVPRWSEGGTRTAASEIIT